MTNTNAGASPDLALHSRYLRRLVRRYPDELHLLPAGVPTRQHMLEGFGALRAQGHAVDAALRILRHTVMARLIVLDCDAQADLADVTGPMTALAEFALDVACEQAFAQLDARHGAPLLGNGARAQLWVVGMGKLGARELNVSSDIDLIYIYDEDGETAGSPGGRGRITNHEYFGRAVKIISQLVGENSEHGFVFRVDLALRPNGNSGPPTASLSALETYLFAQGREWERFAWMKSRVVAPQDVIRKPEVQALRAVVLPFVFRKYLDYNVFESLRSLHRQIREHAQQRSAGRPERANDVKISRGGIREIEFTVQLLQVVRGGQFPELRCRPTLQALQRLGKAGLMPEETAQAMARAYIFLRRVEHRIQYLDDQQTHVLPTNDEDVSWIARTMGFPDTCTFLQALYDHRERVAQEFDVLLGQAQDRPCLGKVCTCADLPGMEDVLEEAPPQLAARMKDLLKQPRYAALREDATRRMVQLMQRTLQWIASGEVSEVGAVRMVDWMEPLLRRESYLALLYERPPVHERLLHVLAAAKWPVRYLMKHPGVIDELADSTLLSERFSPAVFEQELESRLAALRRTGEDDDEALLDLLRRAHHAEIFRTLARDVEECLTVEQVADDLSALADSVLRVTARWCWQRLRKRHREEPHLIVIAYGKLGGLELGYGSDLDLVFVYEDDDESAPEIYAAFVRKLIAWLSTKTGEGDLYEIDTDLRPNGNSGLLVTSFGAYADYQQQRGSNTAWTWEHQAMTRARFVFGEGDTRIAPALRARFEQVREAVITAPRDPEALRKEILAMSQRVRAAHPVRTGYYDLKHSAGGMMDAEFAVQYLVLSQSAQHPALRLNVGNIALLQRAEQAGLLPQGVGMAAASAYRTLRQAQHRARLNEEPTRVELPALQKERQAIVRLWDTVFAGHP